jgi:hypothetical protein
MRTPLHFVVVIVGSLTLAVCQSPGDPRSAQERREDEEKPDRVEVVEGEDVKVEEEVPIPATSMSTSIPPSPTPILPTAAPSGESSEIIGLDSGRWEGEFWFNVQLATSILARTEKSSKAFEVWLHPDGGGVINLSYNMPAGGEPFVSSFCVGELSEVCPGGVFPVGAEVSEDGIKLTFKISGDSFPDPKIWQVSASVETEATDESEDLVERVDYLEGQRFNLGTDERDPC